MNEYEYSINEEITRWVLEVYINNHTDNWKIAFTNPTAGPWKKIIAPSTSKEIYRFIREEARPDLIIVNDILSTILIIEAKDDNGDLFINEAADLLYHLLILLKAKGVTIEDVEDCLLKRNNK